MKALCTLPHHAVQWICFLAFTVFAGIPPAQAAQEGIPCTPEPTDMTIAYGSMIICSIDVAGDVDVFRFSGATGERVYITAARVAGGNPCVELFGPGGNSLGGNCNQPTALAVTLTASGSHTIRISEWNSDASVDYALTLDRVSAPPSPNAIPIGFAQSLSGDIDPVGDADLYFFSAALGDTVTIQASRLTGGNPCAELFNPAGTSLGGNCNQPSVLTATIATAGIHTVRISEWNADQTVSYRLDLQCVGTCPSVPHPAVLVTITGCTACRVGDVFSARATISNAPPSVTELKLGFVLPGGSAANIGDPHLELPQNFSFDGEIAHYTVPAGLAQGTWQFCGRLLELQLGATISESCQSFTVGP